MDRQDSAASEETLINLQQLDPSPIESPEVEDRRLSDPPALTPPAKFHSLGLSGGGHSSVYYLTRLQKYSSYAFTIFTTIHVTNSSILPLLTSLPASENYLLLTRPYYHSFPFEPLLITLPIATHVLSGLALRINRRNANLRRYGAANLSFSSRFQNRVKIWPPLSGSSLSGYVLIPLVLGHAFVNRLLPWIYEGGSSSVGLGFVAHGFAKHPFISWTGYFLLITTGAGHMVWGVAKWNNWVPTGNDKKAKRRWWAIINAISATFAGLWMAGGLGVVGRGGKADGWIGKGYDALFAKIPLLKL